MELIFIFIALYTITIIVIRFIQVTYAPPADRLAAFATTQFPSTVGLFLAVQLLSILTSMEHAKFTMMSGSRVGKDVTSVKGVLSSNSKQVKSGDGNDSSVVKSQTIDTKDKNTKGKKNGDIRSTIIENKEKKIEATATKSMNDNVEEKKFNSIEVKPVIKEKNYVFVNPF